MNSNSIRQRGPALALVQLLTEHPELPTLRWGIGPDGHLDGSMFHLPDLDTAVKAYAAVFGEEPHFGSYTSNSDGLRYRSVSMYPVWRDVQFYITLGGGVVEDVQVTAVAA